MDNQVVDRLRRVLKGAKRLEQDAVLLAEHQRFTSSYALALLSIEEIGKVLIELWKNEAFWDDRAPPEVRSKHLNFHLRKQIAFACLIFAGEVIHAKGKVPDEERDPDQFRALYREVFDREDSSAILIDAMFGVLNKNKEFAFYADREDWGALEVPEPVARQLLEKHADAIQLLADYRIMAFARPTYHHALTVIAKTYSDLEAG